MAEHPIKDYLLRNVENPFRRPLEAALLDHGRPFVGIARPKGYRRLRRVQHCFFNSLTIATDECGTYPQGGTYVEGYAISRDGRGVPLHHAWITLDGTNAIDVTWRAPLNNVSILAYRFRERCCVLLYVKPTAQARFCAIMKTAKCNKCSPRPDTIARMTNVASIIVAA
jgi:hypothetical protein